MHCSMAGPSPLSHRALCFPHPCRLPHTGPPTPSPLPPPQVPTIAALAYHKSTGRSAQKPNQRLSYADNFLFMLDGGYNPAYKPNPRLARALVSGGRGRQGGRDALGGRGGEGEEGGHLKVPRWRRG